MTVPAPQMLQRADGPALAYRHGTGAGPTLVFLPGFKSDMEGTKALALHAHCRMTGQAILRLDYSGHGASGGVFEEGTIGQWTADALAVIDVVTEGPLIVVGSSMGGWIALLVALARSERVKGLIGIAAAPDFTEDLMWQSYSQDIRREIMEKGVYMEPSDYDEPLPITKRLIADGREHLLLDAPIPLTCPVHLIQGMRDNDVPWGTAMRILEQLESEDVDLTLVKGGDHRLSEPRDLARLAAAVDRMVERVTSPPLFMRTDPNRRIQLLWTRRSSRRVTTGRGVAHVKLKGPYVCSRLASPSLYVGYFNATPSSSLMRWFRTRLLSA